MTIDPGGEGGAWEGATGAALSVPNVRLLQTKGGNDAMDQGTISVQGRDPRGAKIEKEDAPGDSAEEVPHHEQRKAFQIST